MRVLVAADADEHPGAGAYEFPRGQGGVVEGVPGDLQEHAVLGVHGGGLVGADPEELRVEARDVVEEGAVPGDVGGRGGFPAA
nr:hypothetical protein [Streptomyces sp. S1D4-11]QIY92926.1 hypothetical protein HEP87_47345 [Streptomyces sp. S1D4-11]